MMAALVLRFVIIRAVRSRAAWALGKLTGLSTRVDPLVGDLISGLQVPILTLKTNSNLFL